MYVNFFKVCFFGFCLGFLVFCFFGGVFFSDKETQN